jgi:hypothetical protein
MGKVTWFELGIFSVASLLAASLIVGPMAGSLASLYMKVAPAITFLRNSGDLYLGWPRLGLCGRQIVLSWLKGHGHMARLATERQRRSAADITDRIAAQRTSPIVS